MKATIINVGYGDALLLEAANGYTALIDGGSLLPGEYEGHPCRIPAAQYLQKRGITRLDDLFITHIHEDHVGGLAPIVERCVIGRMFIPYPAQPFLSGKPLAPDQSAPRSVALYTAALNSFVMILLHAAAQGIPVSTLRPGDTVETAGGISISALAPKPDSIAAYMALLAQVWASGSPAEQTALLTELDRLSNSTSLMLKADGKEMVFLDAADCTPQHWDEIAFSLLQNVNVLKLPHHGQIDCFDARRMGAMPLQGVVTTASSDRRYNSAHPAVYTQLAALFAQQGRALTFLFSDERSYPPWFVRPEGFQAITLEMDSGTLRPEFITII